MKTTKTPPFVSVVIPVYNGANYLRLAIDSALAQTYVDTEVIVVNDGSSDGGATERICHSFGDRIRYVCKPNGGVSSALNLGIEMMQGDYFSWLSHDDTLYPEKTERQVKFLQENPDARVVGSGLEVVDEDGKSVSTYVPRADVVARNGRDVMDTWVHGCSLLIERTVFEEAGYFNVSNRTVQDLEMWLSIARHGIPFYFVPEVLCQWRLHSESGSFAGRKSHFTDVEQFFAQLIPQYSLGFFSKASGASSLENSAETYEWLGEQARHRGAAKIARQFYWSSWIRNPNPASASSRLRLRKFLSHLRRPQTLA